MKEQIKLIRIIVHLRSNIKKLKKKLEEQNEIIMYLSDRSDNYEFISKENETYREAIKEVTLERDDLKGKLLKIQQDGEMKK